MYFQVIMPVGNDPLKKEKEGIIRGAAKDLTPRFPRYSSQDPVFNLQASLADLRGAEFVIADVSLERPSCYYELGLAEALGRPVYLVAQEGTNIHQMADRRATRFFRDLTQFREIIEEIIHRALRSGVRPKT